MAAPSAAPTEGPFRTRDVLVPGGPSDFGSLLLSAPVLAGLEAAGFHRPSPVQLKAIPLGRCGLDLIVQAKSGTGKTCVFSTIALDAVLLECPATQILILAPTREIAVQIHAVITTIGIKMEGLECHVFIGGTPLNQDKIRLKKCHIAVGSPGRIKQLIELDYLNTASIRLFILDEADKLLEEGSFQEQINWIYSSLPANKQMLAVSATYPESLANALTRYMRDPTFVRLNPTDPSLIGLKQYYKIVTSHPLPHKTFEEKTQHLQDLFSKIPFNQALVFSNLHSRAQHLAEILTSRGFPAECISGSMNQNQRLDAMAKLKQFHCRVLISTDLTSRGIDAEKVNLVINLDVPVDWETYMHRIGRAGRFGTLGLAVTYCCRGEEENVMMKIAQKCNLQLLPLPGSRTAEAPEEGRTMEEFAWVDEDWVREQLGNLDIHKSMDADGMHLRLLRELAEVIAGPLSIVFAKSWETGEVPEDWRKANVTPVFKKGKKEDPEPIPPGMMDQFEDGEVEIKPVTHTSVNSDTVCLRPEEPGLQSVRSTFPEVPEPHSNLPADNSSVERPKKALKQKQMKKCTDSANRAKGCRNPKTSSCHTEQRSRVKTVSRLDGQHKEHNTQSPEEEALKKDLPRIPCLSSFKNHQNNPWSFSDFVEDYEYFIKEGSEREVEILRSYSGPGEQHELPKNGGVEWKEVECNTEMIANGGVSSDNDGSYSSRASSKSREDNSCFEMFSDTQEKNAVPTARRGHADFSSTPEEPQEPSRVPKQNQAKKNVVKQNAKQKKSRCRQSPSPSTRKPEDDCSCSSWDDGVPDEAWSYKNYWKSYYQAWQNYYAAVSQYRRSYRQFNWVNAYHVNSVYLQELLKSGD